MKRFLFFTLIVLVAAVVIYKFFYPTYSYRYRLTINIEADGKLHSASSVVGVSWSAFDLPSYHFNPELSGQATLINLEAHGVVVATLISGKEWGPVDGALGTLWIVPRAFDLKKGYELSALERLRGRRELVLNDLPRFLWLSNPLDPMTARTLSVQDFPKLIGPSVRFVGASVEITNDPLVIDIRGKLPWLRPLEQRPAWDNVIYLTDGFPVSRALFIGDGS